MAERLCHPRVTFTELTAKAAIDISFDDWEAAVAQVAPAQRSATWWLGDLLAHGEQRQWGETYAVAAAVTNRTRGYLRNLAYVSRQVAPSSRRADIPWRAHRAVAPLAADEQREWLATAAAEGWTADELERKLRQGRSRNEFPDPERDSCPTCGRPWEHS